MAVRVGATFVRAGEAYVTCCFKSEWSISSGFSSVTLLRIGQWDRFRNGWGLALQRSEVNSASFECLTPISPIRRVAPAMRGIQRRGRWRLTSRKGAFTALARLSKEFVNLLSAASI